MKKKFLLLVILIAVAALQCNAQITKGSIFLGGQISFYNQSASSPQAANLTQKNSQFNISPAYGLAIKENIVIGGDLSYSYAKVLTTNYPYNQVNKTYGAGVFMRRYVTVGKRFYVFGQGRIGGTYNTEKITQGDPSMYDDVKGFTAGFYFYPGVSYQLSKRVQLETGFNNLFYIEYDHSRDSQTNAGVLTETKTNTFSAGTSLSNLAAFTLGIRVLISK